MSTTTVTWQDVAALAPELASVSAELQTAVLDQVTEEVCVEKWGTLARANIAAGWLARHVATIYGRGQSGALSSVSVGGVSKSFSVPAGASRLSETGYGREYLRLVRLWLPRMLVANS